MVSRSGQVALLIGVAALTFCLLFWTFTGNSRAAMSGFILFPCSILLAYVLSLKVRPTNSNSSKEAIPQDPKQQPSWPPAGEEEFDPYPHSPTKSL